MKSFYKKFFILMLPMALKELISALVNLVDTIMVGNLGENAIAAVGIGNQVYFLFTVFLFGISCGSGIFASQFWGNKNISGMRKILGLNILLGTGLALIFVIAATVFPMEIFKAFNAAPQVIEEGVPYLRMVALGYVATAITMAFDMNVCCSEKAGLPFIVRVIGLLVNVVLNWAFIFGNLGFSPMGVMGAAYATVIARCTELIVMLSVVYGKKMVQAAGIKELFTIPKDMVGRFFKIASHVIFNEVAWATGITVYSWVFAQMSAEGMVVITIVQNIERLMMVFFHGAGNAGGVIIGKTVGAEEYDKAYLYGKKLIGLFLGAGVILAGVFICARPLMLLPYNVSESVLKTVMDILVATSILMVIKSATFLLIVGIFRNGGDAKVSSLIDTGCVWLVGVPTVIISGLIFKLPLLTTYIIMGLEEIVKIFLTLWRFKSKKWINNIVK